MNAQISAPRESRAPSWRVAVLAVGAAAACFGVVVQPTGASDAAQDLSPPAPPLPEPVGACAVAREQVSERARSSEAAALAAIARYPFDPREGLRALARLADAQRCYEDAGDAASLQRVQARALSWRARIERDYGDHAARYRLARSADRRQQAVADAEFLLALLGPYDGAFAEHLRQARAALAAQADAAEEAP